MKKTLLFLGVLILLVTLCAAAVAAPFSSVAEDPLYLLAISPRYSYTSSISASLSFSGGNANCSGAVSPSGEYNCSITVTLYKQNGSSWDYIASWSGSGTGGSQAAAGGSVSVGSGTYKVVASGNVAGKEFPSKSVTRTKN